MKPHPPGLAGQLAQFRASAPAEAGCGTVSAALHALIAAIFARIFTRLEQILALWQSGDLPSPAIRLAASTKPARHHKSPRRTARPARQLRQNAPIRAITLRIRPATHQTVARANTRPRRSIPSYFRPRPARAPPKPRQRCRLSPSTGNADLRPN